LFIGIIVDAMQTQHIEGEATQYEETTEELSKNIREELGDVRQELASIKKTLKEKL